MFGGTAASVYFSWGVKDLKQILLFSINLSSVPLDISATLLKHH